MIFDVELLNLILYCVQQTGVALGFGAQTIMLVAYLQAARDNVVDEKETRFLRAIQKSQFAALALIVGSGIGITVLHLSYSGSGVVLAPAFLFKWALIVAVLVLSAIPIPYSYKEAIVGGSWYALFLVHILAPVTTWINLLILWGMWMIGFAMVWTMLVLLVKDKKGDPKVVPEKTPTPQPVPPAPAPIILPQKPVATQTAPTSPAPFIKLDPAQRDIPVQQPKVVAPPPLPTMAPPTPPQAALVQPPKADAPVAPTMPASPAHLVTDKPFLPQVPPLEPIIAAMPTADAQKIVVPGVGIPPNPKDAPLLQKPQEIAPTNPDALSHVQVMPKSPDQIK